MDIKKTSLILFTFLMAAFFNIPMLQGEAATVTALLDVNKQRTYVPIRFVSEQFGAEVDWNGKNQTVIIKSDTKIVILKIGDSKAEVNKEIKEFDAPPFIKDSVTYVPLRFISTILGTEPIWNENTSSVDIKVKEKIITLKTIRYNTRENALAGPAIENSISESVRTYKVAGKSIKANVVTIDLNNPSIDLKIGLAKNQIGEVESLAGIAKRNGATVAINGTFFDAYTNIKEPYGMVIADGKIMHIGRDRTVFSFDSKNNVTLSIMDPEIKGSTNGSDKWPNNWYSYWLNRTPQYNAAASVVIFTPDRGESIGFAYGTNVVVENGKVKEIISDKDVKIPKDGFVINLMGTEVHSLLSRFTPGTVVDYKVINEGLNFDEIDGAVAAGPRLVTNGKITIDFDGEGFKDEKIRTASAARSGIGVTKDKKLILLTTTSSIIELAEIMKQAGAYQAMNLDGGASSGLYYNGQYIRTPGREISNAILVINK